MKVKVSVAVLAACSVLALTAPVSAQFKGLKAMKKALETATEVLEEPKPTPQPQPPARPTPPRAPAPIAAPIPAQQTAAPVNAQIVSAEVWNCFSDVSPKPIRFELNYTSTQKKNEQGSFREISPFDNEGNETRTPNVSSGSFRYEQTETWDFLKLEYDDQSKEYRSFISSVLDDGVRFGEMDNLQCELVN